MKNFFKMDMTDIQICALQSLKRDLESGTLTFFYQPCPCGEGGAYFKVANQDRYGLALNYVCCRRCGLVRLYPNMNEVSWRKFYVTNYPALKNSVGENSVNNFQIFFDKEVIEGKRIFKSPNLQIKLGETSIQPKLLDIGCGYGGMVQLASEYGYDASGCDYDPNAVSFAFNKGLDIRLGGIEQFSAYRGQFDVIILSHVLEHVSSPAVFLSSVTDLLKEGGYLYIELPGYREITFARYRGQLFRYLRIHHPFNFDLKSLCILAQRSGLSFQEGSEWIQAWFKKSSTSQFLNVKIENRKGLQFYFIFLKFKFAGYLTWKLLRKIKKSLRGY